jgi:hypothetical protein
MNNKQNDTNNKSGRVLAVPSPCELYPGICLTTEEKAWKNPRLIIFWILILNVYFFCYQYGFVVVVVVVVSFSFYWV